MTEAVQELSVGQFFVYRWRRQLTAVLLLSGFIVALCSPPLLRIDGFADQTIDLVGYAALFGGMMLRMWAVMSISCKKSKEVVRTGPYALCRNPLYLGTFLIAVGFLCLVQSVTMTVLAIPVVLVYLLGVVPLEERVMLARHGATYEEYCRTTPRWIPRFNSQNRFEIVRSWNTGVRREMECCFWWIAFAALVHVTCDLRMEPWWVHPFNLP